MYEIKFQRYISLLLIVLIYDKVFCFSYSQMLLGTTIMAEQSRDSGTCVIDLFGCLVTAPSSPVNVNCHHFTVCLDCKNKADFTISKLKIIQFWVYYAQEHNFVNHSIFRASFSSRACLLHDWIGAWSSERGVLMRKEIFQGFGAHVLNSFSLEKPAEKIGIVQVLKAGI